MAWGIRSVGPAQAIPTIKSRGYSWTSMPDTLKGAHETHLSARRLHWAWMGGRTFLAHRAPVNVLRAICHLDCARTSRKGSAGDVARTTISSPTSLLADSFGEASKGGGIFSGQRLALKGAEETPVCSVRQSGMVPSSRARSPSLCISWAKSRPRLQTGTPEDDSPISPNPGATFPPI